MFSLIQTNTKTFKLELGRDVTRPYKPVVRSDYNEGYRSGRVAKKKIRKRDSMIKKPDPKKSAKMVQAKHSLKMKEPNSIMPVNNTKNII